MEYQLLFPIKLNRQNRNKRVLIVPFNWGLGHATRLIPVIKQFLHFRAEVIIAGCPEHRHFFLSENLPTEFIEFPAQTVILSKSHSQILKIFLQIPVFIYQIIREHFALKKVIRKKKIDIVVSDNCYGLWNRKVFSIFITHQINIQLPKEIRWLQGFINKINHRLIRRFDMCWIPDLENNNGIAGILSHGLPENISSAYIGLLSRFTGMQTEISERSDNQKSLLCILSGPEPQRSILESIIEKEQHDPDENIQLHVIRGKPGDESESKYNGWHNHLPSDKLIRLILQADYIICRSGYSTVMDLLALGKTAMLVPTPGQTEQEYLAGYLSEKGLFLKMTQKDFSVLKAIEMLSVFKPSGIQYQAGRSLLKNETERVLRLTSG